MMEKVNRGQLIVFIIFIVLIVSAIITGIFMISSNKKGKVDLVSVSDKLFEKHMDELLNVPEKKNIQSSYTITSTKIIAGNEREFVAEITYNLMATIQKDTETAECKWDMRIKRDSFGKYDVVEEGATVKTDGLKAIKSNPEAAAKENQKSQDKLSLDSPNKYSIRGSRLSVTYDNGANWVDVPVTLQDLVSESRLEASDKSDTEALEVGSYYITPKKTAFIYGDSLEEGGSPLKIVMTDNQGKSWYTVNVPTVDAEYGYASKFIGFTSQQQGYIVLTSSVAMGHQENYIYETNDGGNTWNQIGNTNNVYARVVTGAGFANDKIGFVGFRYENDNNPTVYRTADRGATWKKLNITLPGQYANDYATPLCPVFDGKNGVLPVTLRDSKKIIQFITSDYGVTWKFDKDIIYSNQKK